MWTFVREIAGIKLLGQNVERRRFEAGTCGFARRGPRRATANVSDFCLRLDVLSRTIHFRVHSH